MAGGQNAFSRPEHTLPPGYNSKGAIKMLARHPGGSWLGVSPDKLRESKDGELRPETDYDVVRKKLLSGYQKVQNNHQLIIGSPKTVIPKLKLLLQILRPGVFVFFNVQGTVSNEDRLTSMRLIANEVMPELREYAKEIDLPDSYQRTPGSVALQSGVSPAPVSDRGPLEELGLR